MFLQVSFAPLVPLWMLAGAGAAAALYLLVACGLRGWRLGWRALPLGLLLLALAGPHLQEEQRTALKDIVMLVADRTPSQELGERAAQRDAALAHMLEQIGRHEHLEARVLEVAGDGLGGGVGGGSRLFQALREALEGLPRERLAGAVLVTDGQIHDVPGAEERDLGMPVHALLSGERGERDRVLRIEHGPGFGFVGDEVEAVLHARDWTTRPASILAQENTADSGVSENLPPPQGAELRLRLDGEDLGLFPVSVGTPIPIRVPVANAGGNILEAEISALDGEAFLGNNRIALEIQGIRERLRVLLVSGKPHPGMRVWRWLLRGDAAVDLVHFTVLRDPSQGMDIPVEELSLIPFPARELFLERLDEFDLVIFDNYRLRGILPPEYFANITRYVHEGGALLVASGQDFATPHGLYNSALAEVLPLRPTGGLLERQYVPRIEGAGERHPVTAPLLSREAAEWGDWYRLVEGEALGGQILMTGLGGRPLLGLQRVGNGRVAQLLSDHIWLWARGYQGGGPHADLLRGVAHWLMREPELEEERLWGRIEEGRLVVERASMGDAVAPARVSSAAGGEGSGTAREVALEARTPGRWSGEVDLEESGLGGLGMVLLRVESDGLEARVMPPRDAVLEGVDVRARADLLAPVVEANGGFLGWIGEGDALPRVLSVDADAAAAGVGWLGLRENGAYNIGAVERVALLRGFPALLLFFASLGLCWWRETR